MSKFAINQVPGKIFLEISVDQFFRQSDGKVLLSEELATEKEVDDAVNRLIECLEQVRLKGKRLLKKQINAWSN